MASSVKKPAADAVQAYKEKNYFEAVLKFTDYLNYNKGDKIAFYNRGMSFARLNSFHNALADGDECVNIDAAWAKGYKCKVEALVALGRLQEAVEVLQHGDKLVTNRNDSKTYLQPLMSQLNQKMCAS